MRTELNKVEESVLTGKFAVSFNNWNGIPGDEYIASTVRTSHVYATEDEAYAAGVRALAILNETGYFPNFSDF